MKKVVLSLIGLLAFAACGPNVYQGNLFSVKQEMMINKQALMGKKKSKKKNKWSVVSYYMPTLKEAIAKDLDSREGAGVSYEKAYKQFRIMDIRDMNGDGKDEVILLTGKGLYVYTVPVWDADLRMITKKTIIGSITTFESVMKVKFDAFISTSVFKGTDVLSRALNVLASQASMSKSMLSIMDINNDGMDDLVIDSGAKSVSIILNKNLKFKKIDSFPYDNSYQLKDINGDKILDFVNNKGSQGLKITFLKDTGALSTIQFPKDQSVLAVFKQGLPFVTIDDLTGNGAEDIIINYQPLVGMANMEVFEYNKSKDDFVKTASFKKVPFKIATEHIFSDKLKDIYTLLGPLQIFENKGNNNFVKHEIKGIYLHREAYVYWDDFDNNGLKDVLLVNVTAGVLSPFHFNKLYYNKGGKFEACKSLNGRILGTIVKQANSKGEVTNSYILKRIRSIDFDGDGYKDIITWGNNRFSILKNENGRGFKPMFSGNLPGDLSKPQVFYRYFSDFNGDGTIDFWSGFFVYLNDGKKFVRSGITTLPDVRFIKFEDVDKDGKKEAIVYNEKGFLSKKYGLDFYKQDKGMKYKEMPKEFIPNLKRDKFFIVDYNHDGKVDVIDTENNNVFKNKSK